MTDDSPIAEPDRPPIVVRYNRTAAAWLLVVGAATLLALLIRDLLFDPRGSLSFAGAYLAAGLLAYSGSAALIRTAYFTFDPDTERLVARTLWGRVRTYPRPGFDWIAYSTGPLQIREVAPDGRSRKISVSHLIADPDDWSGFLDHLLDLSAPDEPDPTEGRA